MAKSAGKPSGNAGKSSIHGKIGKKGLEAFNAVKDEQVQVRGRVPAGVRGIARLDYVKFDEFKTGTAKGKTYFTGRATVVEPKEFAGLPIFMKNEPVYDTPEAKGDRARKTTEDHVREVANRLKLLGLEAEDLKPKNLEAAIESLNKSGVEFRFESWQMKKRQKGDPGYNEKYDGPNAKEPDVQFTWGMFVDASESTETEEDEDDDDDTATSAAEDDSGDDDDGDDAETEEAEAGDDDDAEEAGDEDDAEEAEAAEEPAVDWLAIGKKADKGDAKAGKKIQEHALSLGFTKAELKDPDKYEKFVDVAKAIIAKEAGGDDDDAEDEDEDEAEAEASFSVGDKVKFKHPKTKKLGDYKVTAVDEDDSTVDLTNVKDKADKHKGIAFDKLNP